MDNGKQKISPERINKILRTHHWIYSFIIALILPATVIAICGFRSVWEVIFLFGGSALLAWTIYWTNWVNSVIFAVGVPSIVITFTNYRSVWNTIVLFGGCSFIVCSLWFWLWVKKRISKDFYAEKK
jgi:predicted membrane protein